MRTPFLKRVLKAVWRGLFDRNTVRRSVKGKGNVLEYRKARLKDVRIKIRGNGNTIRIDEGCRLQSVEIVVFGDHHSIHLQPGVTFNRGGTLWMEDSHGQLSIGERTSIEDAHLAVTEPHSQLKIGCDGMLAYDIDIRTGDSHSILDAATGVRLNPPRNVRMGDRVWVAAHCQILKGVEIAHDTIVGTGSVVTKGFGESGVVIAGNPAKVVRRGVRWVREKVLC